jgi:hypothetical protein
MNKKLTIKPQIEFYPGFPQNNLVKIESNIGDAIRLAQRTNKNGKPIETDILLALSQIKTEQNSITPSTTYRVKYTNIWNQGKRDKYRSVEGQKGHQKFVNGKWEDVKPK